jgi:hypothetical protein
MYFLATQGTGISWYGSGHLVTHDQTVTDLFVQHHVDYDVVLVSSISSSLNYLACKVSYLCHNLKVRLQPAT